MSGNGWSTLAQDLVSLLRLDVPPVAITFTEHRPDGIDAFDAPMSQAAEVVDRLRATVAADSTVATYAAEDRRRFV
jgi:uncharacterized protein (DUF169 family)